MKTAVFCDFDGTVSRRDVGYAIFHHFSKGKNDELLPDWKAGRLSTRECLLQEAAMVRAPAEEIYRFIDRFEIDSGFNAFVKLCEKNQTPIFIVSDGLDFYIKFILKKYNLSHLPFVANIGRPENDSITVEFPHQNISCSQCGICKGEMIQDFRRKSKEDYRIIFIGDGYSDACATGEADVIFAKKDLEQYCQKKNISYYGYDTFYDTTRRMLELGYLTI